MRTLTHTERERITPTRESRQGTGGRKEETRGDTRHVTCSKEKRRQEKKEKGKMRKGQVERNQKNTKEETHLRQGNKRGNHKNKNQQKRHRLTERERHRETEADTQRQTETNNHIHVRWVRSGTLPTIFQGTSKDVP